MATRWAGSVILLFAASAVRGDEPVSFHRQIRPLLQRHCIGCHQPAGKQSDLSLTTYDEFRRGGRKGPGFVAGKPDDSTVLGHLTGKLQPQMPFGGRPLADDQVALFRRWILEGAHDDSPAEPSAAALPGSPTVYHSAPMISALAFSSDGALLAVSGYREIVLHNLDRGLVARLPGLSERIHSLVFSPDGATLVAAGGSPARFGELQVWDVNARKQRHSVVVTNDTLFGASLSPDGHTVAAGGADKSIRLFDVATGKELRKIDHHEDWVFGTVFGSDGKRLVSVSRDRAAKLTDVSTGAFIENVNLLREGLTAIARHPKRDWVLIGGQERIPYLYRMDRPRAMRIADDSTLIRKFDKQDGPILALAISPDGQYAAVAAEAGDVRIYNLETGELSGTGSGQAGGVYTVTFHPAARLLAAAGFDGTVRLYEIGGKLVKAFVPVPVAPAEVSQK